MMTKIHLCYELIDMTPKRSPISEIVDRIFEELRKNGFRSISEVSRATGIHHNTVKNYIELIETIQKQPKLIVEKTQYVTMLKLEKET